MAPTQDGVFVAGVSKPWKGGLSPWEAELVGIQEALSWVKANGWDFVEVESDASKAILEILYGSSDSPGGILAGNIRELGPGFTEISFFHVRRSTNKVAHVLTQGACSISDSICWVSFPPNVIFHVLNIEAINNS
ncbi:unnamed protein product [Cuscuta epithymum]|uniref:RNase H type-1 domain-containing protein n=1 Tax=Cuscuta epithymum TaxID=186058 RepID=A0AAV0CHK6_9ASTE|nr:unnamed protein product [Cuscuta epithymum]